MVEVDDTTASDGSGSTSDDYQQLEHERTVLYLKVLFYVHLFIAVVFVALYFVGLSAPDLTWVIWALVLATPSILLVFLQGTGTRAFQSNLRVIEIGATWGLAAFYIRASLMQNTDGPSLFPMAVVALVITLRAAVVPSTLWRTFWAGMVPVAVVLAASFAYPRPHEPIFFVIWNGVVGLCFVATTIVTSHVIYGLQQRLSDIKKLGQYELEKKLGEGGMGKVYLARHAMLRRLAAVKLLSEGGQVSKNAAERFRDEVQFTSRLTHPNTVHVFDYGLTPQGQFFYAMEYLDGATLQALVEATGPMPPARVAYVLKKVAASLVEAHGEGLLHRDIKPANIMLCKLGGVFDSVKVLDFGLVQAIDARTPGNGAMDDVRLEGTPGYLAPECIVDAAGSEPRSDLYGLGAVGYFLLTGRPPFHGEDVVDVLAQHLTEEPRLPSDVLQRAVDQELERLILSCLEKDPELRPSSSEALLRELIGISERLRWSPEERAIWWAEHAGVMESYREANTDSVGTARKLRIGRGTFRAQRV